MGLFKPVWMKEDYMGRKHRDKALAVVARMSDQNKLREVAMTTIFDDVVLLACKKLQDQKAIADAALRRSRQRLMPFNAGLADELVSLIKDPSLLKKAAIEGDDYSIGPAAVRAMTLEADLAEVARKGEYGTRIAAIGRLTDQAVLEDIALNDREGTAAVSALRTLSDPAVLSRVLTQMPQAPSLRAMQEGKRKSELKKLVEACGELTDKVRDPAALEAVAGAWKELAPEVSQAALRRKEYLEFQSFFPGSGVLTAAQKAAVNAYFAETDILAKLRLIDAADQPVLAEIARREPNHSYRMHAMERIKSEGLRREIRASWSDAWRRADEMEEMRDRAIQRDNEARTRRQERLNSGRCPNCGVLLAMLPNAPAGAALFCSNCKARIGTAAQGGGIR